MVKSKKTHRPPRNYPFSQLSKKILRRTLRVVPLFLCVLAGGIIYGIVKEQLFIVLLLAAVGCLVCAEWLVLFLSIHKKCLRFTYLSENANYPNVVIVQRAYMFNEMKPESVSIRFFQNKDLALQYVAANDLLLQSSTPNESRRQAKQARSRMEKIGRGTSFSFAPIDLYVLKGKKILIARNIIEYYGEPDSAQLAQNGCTLLILDEQTKNGCFSA